MRPEEYGDRVYRNYVTAALGKAHTFSPAEYELHGRYFQRNYTRHLPPDTNARILDVGCGAGHFLYYLARRGYANASGIDLSQECVDLCLRQGLRAEKADVFQYLQDKSERYDVIVCNDLLEHMTKPQAFALVDLWWQSLAKRGVLLVKVPNMACPVVSCRTRYVDITHEVGYTDHSLRTLLTMRPFEDVRLVGLDIYVTKNPLANMAGRTAFAVVTAVFRMLYRLYGVETRHVMTKSVLGVARKPEL